MTGKSALVDPPMDPGASMLVMEVGNKSGPYSSSMTNNGNTGWVPWVVDDQGELVRFKLYDNDLRLDSLYYAQGVRPGTYTLKGFIHIWADTSISPKLSAFSYNPYDNLPYQRRQEFVLQEPMVINLGEAQIASFGRYFIKAVWKGGYASSAYDRWMINPMTYSVEALPGDSKALEVLESWKNTAWLAWVSNRTLHASGIPSRPMEVATVVIEPEPSVKSGHTPPTSGLLDFDAGGWHTMIIRSDGSVWGTGNNERGQLGITGAVNQPKPVNMFGHAKALALGQSFSLALKQDGTVWATGNNYSGALGDLTNDDASTFHQVAQNTKSIAAGYVHSALIKQDGTLWTAGDNRGGQLGDGTQENRTMFLSVASDVASVSAGGWHTCYITNGGALYGFGYNSSGQLGDGSTAMRTRPMQILDSAIAVACGAYHTMILKTDGTLWATGNNEHGQLGDGTTTNRSLPVQIAQEVTSVSAGEMFTLFIKHDGTLWSMGYNGQGQLGDGTREPKKVPVQVMEHIVAVEAGYEHAIALDRDGRLWGFGSNSAGQLGDGTDNNYRVLPVRVFLNE